MTTATFCLATDLLDWSAYPAGVLAAGYKWRWDGSERAADRDAGGCLAGGDAASGGGERLPGFGFVVAVPVTAGCYPASAQFVQDGVAPVAADRSGEAGGAVAGGGDGGAARGGKRDLAGMDGLPGPAAFPGRDGLAGGCPHHGADQFAGGDPRGVRRHQVG